MSVLLLETNKNGKYEFTKEELQTLLDRVDLEAFERGMAFERKVQEQKYIYINSPTNPCVDWNKVTCTATDPSLIKTT